MRPTIARIGDRWSVAELVNPWNAPGSADGSSDRSQRTQASPFPRNLFISTE
ncbi:hypothetical protein SynBOUM118_01545 [Synechococcus sp. BOUM118]|nr:hypothetical protein SynBOUM118_01545 [Synechococcus sp. BOUM118]